MGHGHDAWMRCLDPSQVNYVNCALTALVNLPGHGHGLHAARGCSCQGGAVVAGQIIGHGEDGLD